MTEFMTRTIKRKKYLLWYNSDDAVEVVEFRVCDCFLDSVLNFKSNLNKFGKKIGFFFFFEEIPLRSAIENVFLFMVKGQLFVVKLHYISLITEDSFLKVKCLMSVWHWILNVIVCII